MPPYFFVSTFVKRKLPRQSAHTSDEPPGDVDVDPADGGGGECDDVRALSFKDEHPQVATHVLRLRRQACIPQATRGMQPEPPPDADVITKERYGLFVLSLLASDRTVCV
jgi:hypothetical protein